ncbi:MAG TPA: hypothetical protein VGK48_00510 [Terriglobia bacterium]|jgi:hypothetical protein
MSDARELEKAAENLRIALEMFGLGESIMRQNLRRSFPDATGEEIEAKLWAWFSDHPGAEFGDAPGRLRPLSNG